jgi:hypothetical protein
MNYVQQMLSYSIDICKRLFSHCSFADYLTSLEVKIIIMSSLYIVQQVALYGGLFLIVTGVIGNGINIFIFSSVRTYRTTPCTFYFLIASIYNMACITINLISGVVSVGSGFDLTRTSTSWCKIRQFCLFTISLITVYCSCLATIDQFLVTSQSANLRRFSNIKWAHRIVFIVSIIWFLHGIPYLLFYNISPITITCVNTNFIFVIYTPIYVIVLLSAVPIVVMVLFAYLASRNIHLTRALAEQQADRQLLRMTLIQVILVVICFVPYGIINAYLLITSGVSKDTNRLKTESLAITIFGTMTYFYYAVCLFCLR